MTINPSAVARREQAREATGRFGHQQHTPPHVEALDLPNSPAHGDHADNPMNWSPEQLEATSHTPAVVLRGLSKTDLYLVRSRRGVEFGAEFGMACRWAHLRGDQPDDLRQVRKFAGQMSDESFRRLYAELAELEQADRSDPQAWWIKRDAIGKRAMQAFLEADGRPVAAPEAPGVSADGYMGGAEFTGSKYEETHNLSCNEVAKLIRADIKEAKKNGILPENVRITVRQRRGTSGFTATAKLAGEDYYEMHYRPWMPIDPSDGNPWRYEPSKEASLLGRRIETVTNRYAYSDVNSMVDYFHTYKDTQANVEPEGDYRPDYAESQRRYEEWRKLGCPEHLPDGD